MKYFVYILRTSAGTLYIGQTNNLERRLKEHRDKKSKSARYVRYFDTFTLVYQESYETRPESMRRELELKSWTKAKKEALISGNLKLMLKE
jgi:putative endonuclease